MSLSPEEQSKLRKEATEQVYRDAFKDNIVAKNRFFVHIISTNCEGYVDGANQNNLEFNFPVLPQGHMKNCRVKVIKGVLPRYEVIRDNFEEGNIIIENLIRDRTYVPIQQTGYAEANQGQSFPIATQFTAREIVHRINDATTADNAYRVNNVGAITTAGGANIVGAIPRDLVVGYEIMPDNEWRWCDNPSGKKIRIVFKSSGFTDVEIERDGAGFNMNTPFPWTLTLLFEFFPDFNSNDRLTN